jgi:hypothetical protein
MRSIVCMALVMLLPGAGVAQETLETFVTIQQVRGNQIAVVPDAGGGGRGMRGGADGATAQGQQGIGRGRRGGAASVQPTIVSVPEDVKITSAMRERRTFEFRVGAELAGGLQHPVLLEMQSPLPARIVTEGNRITEINVIMPETDINQSGTTASGEAVIAVRPKRPPMKRASSAGRAK